MMGMQDTLSGDTWRYIDISLNLYLVSIPATFKERQI